jgi:hypothetical protein
LSKKEKKIDVIIKCLRELRENERVNYAKLATIEREKEKKENVRASTRLFGSC